IFNEAKMGMVVHILVALLIWSLWASYGEANEKDISVMTNTDLYLLVGTYSSPDSNGIHVYRFNSETGDAHPVSTVSQIANPTFLSFSSYHQSVYAVSTVANGNGGNVYAYR